MTQWLRAPVALRGDPGSIPSNYMAHGSSQLSATPVPVDPTPSHRHTYRQNTNVHKIMIKKRKEITH